MFKPFAPLILLLFAYCVYGFHAENFGRRVNADRGQVSMKGKGSKIPVDRRGEFLKRESMMQQMADIEKKKPKGVPIFKIYVRPKTGGIWVPCGDLAGDNRATALVNAWLSGFLEDMYKSQLDKGIARSIFQQEEMFVKQVRANIRPFKNLTKDQLQFGYKVEFAGVMEKFPEQNVTALVKGMGKTWLDNARESVTNLFSGGAK